MYSFVYGTYNPIKGECIHECRYCFMKGFRHRFKRLDPTLRLDVKDLNKSLGSGRLIFVGSSTDEFADNVPDKWITSVLDHLNEYRDNTYQLQSKNPARFHDFIEHPLFDDVERVIFCTTLESDIDHQGISKAPNMKARAEAMKTLANKGFKTMVTVEPIMAFSNPATFADLIVSVNPVQVNIGSNSARSVNLPEPSPNEIEALIKELESRGISVHEKKNLSRLKK